jgi:hypothetical protein
VLLNREVVGFPIVPTLGATPGVRGNRPAVGIRDCKDLLHVWAVDRVITAARPARLPGSPAGAKPTTGPSKGRRLRVALAAHLRHVARNSRAERHPRAVLVVDPYPMAPRAVDRRRLGGPSAPGVRTLPGFGPRRNVIERPWRVLFRRAARHRRFDHLAGLKRAIRSRLCPCQAVRSRVRSLVAKCSTRLASRIASAGPGIRVLRDGGSSPR